MLKDNPIKFVISGSNGLVGSNLAYNLMEYGHYVLGIGRTKEAYYDVDKYLMLDLVESPFNLESINDVCDVFIHCAASKSQNMKDFSLIVDNNLSTLNALNLAVKMKCKTFIYISSIPVIGVPEIIPITEEHPTKPQTLYHASKLFGESLCENYELGNMNIYSFRIPSPIGMNMNKSTLFPALLDKALKDESIDILGKGTREQNYLDLRDLSKITVAFHEKKPTLGVYNIASDHSISNITLAQKIVDLTLSKSEISKVGIDATDNIKWDINTQKMKDSILYENTYTITESIQYILNKELKC